jgi:hypothetical protein
MGELNELPIGRYSPAPGIWVDRTEGSFRISGSMEMYGDEATVARASTVEQSINRIWTKTFSDGYSVTCNITVRYRGPGTGASSNAAQIEVLNPFFNGPSNVNTMPGMGNKMTLNASSPNVFTWTAAHEFGHVIGLEDKYSESIVSSVRGTFGGTRTNTIQPGYEGNLMGAHGGTLGSRNLADLGSENEPSPFWMNDDDNVRNWVNVRPPAEIGRLSTTIKLRAIRTLMRGWISDEDVSAMGKICGSVTTRAEADAIRRGINLLDFTSIGQRTQMRVIFSRMP